MLLGSLALTISTCLSGGCGQVAAANRIEAIKQNANEITLRAATDFDYRDYDLTYDEQQSFTKQKLYDYAEENELFSVEELNQLKETIISDNDFVYFNDIDNLFVKQSASKANIMEKAIDVNSQKLYKDLTLVSVPGTAKIDKSLIRSNLVDMSFDVVGSGSSSGGNDTTDSEDEAAESDETNTESIVQEEFTLPILPYNANNISSSISGKVDDCNFFGILCSKDSCIILYNAFAG